MYTNRTPVVFFLFRKCNIDLHKQKPAQIYRAIIYNDATLAFFPLKTAFFPSVFGTRGSRNTYPGFFFISI